MPLNETQVLIELCKNTLIILNGLFTSHMVTTIIEDNCKCCTIHFNNNYKSSECLELRLGYKYLMLHVCEYLAIILKKRNLQLSDMYMFKVI